MEKGRKIQREWTKVPGGNKISSELSSKVICRMIGWNYQAGSKKQKQGSGNGGESSKKCA